MILCQYCERGYEDLENYMSHILSKHEDICENCGKPFGPNCNGANCEPMDEEGKK